jgi:hypothetical protein
MKIGVGMGVTSALCRGARRAPGSLFRAGDLGFWIDPSAAGSLFQDTAGTMAATLPGQSVARALDRSSQGRHCVQAVAGAQPMLARLPQGGRRNQFGNTANTDAVVGVIGAGGALPLGRDASSGLTRTVVGFGDTAGIPYFDIRFTGTLSGGMFINLTETTGVPALAGQTWITSAHVQIRGAASGVDAIAMVQSTRRAGGFLKFTYPSVSVGFPTKLTRFSTPATNLSNADGTAGNVAFVLPYLRLNCIGAVDITLRIAGTQVERATAASAVQVVHGPADITEGGRQSRIALWHDQVDDRLATTLPAGSYNLAYGDDGGVTILTGQALSGAYSLPGPARLYGIVAINRTLSPAETDSLTRWLNARRTWVRKT